MKIISYSQYQQYLKTLNLSENFTEDELKSSYRQLARQYHPDLSNNQTKDAAKMKEINEAHDVLEDILNGKISIPGNNHHPHNLNNYPHNLNNYINSLITKLQNIMNTDLELSLITGALLQQYSNISITFEVLKNCTSFETANNLYKDITAQIKKFFVAYTEKYFQAKDINPNDITETINYNCRFTDLKQQLQRLNQKYNRKTKYQQLINNAFYEFELHPHYHHLKVLIELIKKETLQKLLDDQTNQTDNIINSSKQQVEDEIFKHYFEELARFQKIQTFLQKENSDNESIQQLNILYNKYYNQFQQETAFSDVDNYLDDLENLIQEYQEQKQLLSHLNDLIIAITANYQTAIQTYINQESTDKLTNLQKLTQLYQDILNALQNYSLTDDIIQHLQQLDFTNLKSGQEFLHNWKQNSKEKSNQNNTFYILHNIKSVEYNWPRFGQITPNNDYPNDQLTITGLDVYGNTKSLTISKEQFNQYYISIDDFFQKANFIGETNYHFNHIIYLYKYDDTNIVIDTTDNALRFYCGPKNSYYQYIPKDQLDFYQNREQIKAKLIQEFQNKMNQNNQQKKRTKTN